MSRRIFNIRLLVVVILTLIVAATVYGLAAANVVPESGAGDGANSITGYTVTNVTYTLDTTPYNLSKVTFNINPTSAAQAPVTVKVALVDPPVTWYACTVGTSPSWSCTFSPAVPITPTNKLRVVAAQ
jgi:hypothetical protein